MCDRDGYPLSATRRFALLSLASVLVFGCAFLALSLRAVPKSELAAVTVAVFYVLAANLLQPSPSQPKTRPDRIRPLALERQFSRAAVRGFLATGLFLSIFIPWVWIALFSPSYGQLQLLGPHLFLMMSQVLFEIWSYRATVKIVVRIGIPVGFVSYRLSVLLKWVQEALANDSTALPDVFMKVLAVSNLCFWGVVLFYVLLLKVCPPYFLEKDRVVNSDATPQG